MKRLWFLCFFVFAAAQAEEAKWVNLASLPIPPVLEIRYATPSNFTGKQLYPFPKALLHPNAAAALAKVQADLAEQGLGLKVWDAYRPISVQQKMWDLIGDDRYVSDPAKNAGRHTRGTTVDVTLVDILGCELEMPTNFDDFSEAAHSDAKATKTATKNRAKLQAAMTKHGFEIFAYEWWHFDLKDWKNYPPMNVGLEQIQ